MTLPTVFSSKFEKFEICQKPGISAQIRLAGFLICHTAATHLKLKPHSQTPMIGHALHCQKIETNIWDLEPKTGPSLNRLELWEKYFS